MNNYSTAIYNDRNEVLKKIIITEHSQFNKE